MRNTWLRSGLIGLLGLVIMGTVFGAGFFVGRRSARLDSVSPAQGGHGAIGRIQIIEGAIITVSLYNGTTQVVVTDNKTRIDRAGAKTTRITLGDLKAGDHILVIGEPNAKGQIVARMIRVSNTPALTPTPSGL